MKQFLRDIGEEWSPHRYWRGYIYYWMPNRWRIRQFLIGTNREIAKTVHQLLTSPISFLICVGSGLLAYGTIQFVSRSDIVALLTNVIGMIVTLLSVLIAAAIFISTIHQKNSNRSIDEEMLLKKRLIESKHVFPAIYDMFKGSMSTEKKVILLKAVPAVSVSNDHDYRQFKKWHKKAIVSIDEKRVQSYDRSIFYPYDLVMEMRGARTYYITEASELSLRILTRTKRTFPVSLMKDVEALRAAAERYQTAGTHGYYVPLHYVGSHLTRIIVYSLLTILAVLSALLLKDYNADVFPDFNYHLLDIVFMTSIVLSVVTFYLILRHVFDFLRYLRESTQYSNTTFDNFYIYEEDETVKNPESTYPDI